MTREQDQKERSLARIRVLREWKKNNKGVRIKQMVGISDNYYITDDGRVFRLSHEDWKHNKGAYIFREQKQYIRTDAAAFRGGAHKYMNVTLSVEGHYREQFHKEHPNLKYYRTLHPVHQLVAHYFCERGLFATQVDHLDSNPTNNRADNLEWVTTEENNRRRWEYYHKVKRGEVKGKRIAAGKGHQVVDDVEPDPETEIVDKYVAKMYTEIDAIFGEAREMLKI